MLIWGGESRKVEVEQMPKLRDMLRRVFKSPRETIIIPLDPKGKPWISQELLQFAWDMARQQQANKCLGAERVFGVNYLLEALEEALKELADAIVNGTNADVIDEAAVVATYAMLIADHYREEV